MLKLGPDCPEPQQAPQRAPAVGVGSENNWEKDITLQIGIRFGHPTINITPG